MIHFKGQCPNLLFNHLLCFSLVHFSTYACHKSLSLNRKKRICKSKLILMFIRIFSIICLVRQAYSERFCPVFSVSGNLDATTFLYRTREFLVKGKVFHTKAMASIWKKQEAKYIEPLSFCERNFCRWYSFYKLPQLQQVSWVICKSWRGNQG